MLREIKGTQRLSRMLALKLVGTGTAALTQGSTDATLVDNGTGDYSITFAKPFARIPVVTVASLTTVVNTQIVPSKTGIAVKSFSVDGTTAKDAVLDLIVLGWDAEDQY